RVVLSARREERKGNGREAAGNGRGGGNGSTRPRQEAGDEARRARLERQRDELTARIEEMEADLLEIDSSFSRPGYFEETSPDAVRALQERRADLQRSVDRMLEEWEGLEQQIEAVAPHLPARG